MTHSTREAAKTSNLPRQTNSIIWVDHHVENEAAAEAFSTWLDDQLELLEQRHRLYCTRRSVAESISR